MIYRLVHNVKTAHVVSVFLVAAVFALLAPTSSGVKSVFGY